MEPSDSKPQSSPSLTRIADLNDADRPREKALKQGIRSLTDTELIAILLGGGLPGKSVIDLSRELYAACGNSLSEMARMPIREMMRRFSGIGPAKAVCIAAALELGGRRKDLKVDMKPQIRTSADAYEAVRNNLENLSIEEFWVILLSRSNRIIAMECVSSGGTAATVVDVKVIMKHVINHLASGIILVHNHPSGNMNPSSQDDALTRKIREAAKLLEVSVLDHIIVGPDSYYSYTDSGKL